MDKKFNEWNEIKKATHKIKKKVYFKERDIFFIRIGENIGFEQSGKGDMFLRPVIILKKFNNNFFMGIPLTTTTKEGIYYFEFEFTNKKSKAILSQIKSFDVKRIKHKIGVINQKDFKKLKEKIGNLYGYMLASSKDEDDPEGVCNKIIADEKLNVKKGNKS